MTILLWVLLVTGWILVGIRVNYWVVGREAEKLMATDLPYRVSLSPGEAWRDASREYGPLWLLAVPMWPLVFVTMGLVQVCAGSAEHEKLRLHEKQIAAVERVRLRAEEELELKKLDRELNAARAYERNA